jgi:pre-rRNA-processing protein TSR1
MQLLLLLLLLLYRDTKRQELLESRRRHSAPLVVALLPLTAAADAQHTFTGLLDAAAAAAGGSTNSTSSSSMATIAAHGRNKKRLTVLKPPTDLEDPLAIVDLAKAADVLLLLLSGSSTAAAVDDTGSSNLAVLRALGLPTCLAVVSSRQHGTAAAAAGDADGDLMEDSEDPMAVEAVVAGAAAGAAAGAKQPPSVSLKQRSAAKKRAEKALQQHLPGDTKLLSGDTTQDMQQLLRVLADTTPQLPVWRRQRPYLMVQQAAFAPSQQQQQQQESSVGELHLTGFIRAQGLSANQLVTVPGAGDFQILRIEAAEEAGSSSQQQQRQRKGAAGAGDLEMADAGASAGGRVLALPDGEQQEQLVRENEPDPLAGGCTGGCWCCTEGCVLQTQPCGVAVHVGCLVTLLVTQSCSKHPQPQWVVAATYH